MQHETAPQHASAPSLGPFGLWVLALLFVAVGMWAGRQLSPQTPRPTLPVALTARVPTPSQLPPRPQPFTFPDGSRQLAGHYRFVALYGAPDNPLLGALGQQPVSQAVDRAQEVAAQYTALSTVPVMPTFEIIATVAAAGPTDNGDYSQETDPAVLQSWIDAASRRNMYVVLDLQPGRSDFLTQAKEYEELLRQPNVGLALDPEWRLSTSQLPLQQIGSVDIGEVNSVAAWLAQLTTANKLPQKLFVLHQFRLDMLPGRDQLNTSYPQLAYSIQMDGQGSQPEKQETWKSITASPPALVMFGWKNFYQKDMPVLDPAATMQISPQPWYISYQ